MQRHRRFVESAGDRFVGFVIVFGLEFGFRPLPQRAGRIDLFGLTFVVDQFDRKLDVVGIGADDALDLVSLEIFCRILFQMQHDLGAARHAISIFLAGRSDFKPIAAGRRPDPGRIGSGAAAGDDDAIGHHEGGVKTDAELADQAGAVFGFLQARHK